MKIKKNTLFLLIGLIVLGVLVWVAYDIPERQRQNKLDDYESCVERRTRELNNLLMSCYDGDTIKCDLTLMNLTVEKIEEVKEECKDTYLRN